LEFWRRSDAVEAKPGLVDGVARGDDPQGEGRFMPRQIGRQAPYLRRYARALTGAQGTGDNLVQACMERMLNGSIVLSMEIPLRQALYSALHQTWIETDRPVCDETSGLVADARLQTLTRDERAALLLVSMEGFTVAEAARILNCGDLELIDRLECAEATLRRQLATDVLIIEDEPIIGLDLTRLTRELGHRVTGVAATRDEAVALAERTRPGLVLADIRLADGSSGMDAAADILESFDIPVIFITAFPEHLLTGDRPEPAFLITKPFREDAVKALIGQALFFHRSQDEPATA
jgi:DNA-directed RNA polymerase specialized sigma24 family protein/CheY-like chemotaxis protein